MIRTRYVIKQLSYDDLVKQNIIPDVFPLIKTSTKRYPPFLYRSKDFAFFGLLTEFVFRAELRNQVNQEFDLGTEPFAEVIPSMDEDSMIAAISVLHTYQTSSNIHDIVKASYDMASTLFGENNTDYNDIKSYIPTYVNMNKDLIAKWKQYTAYLSGKIVYNAEYSVKKLAGHPDLVVLGDNHSVVLDVKNTCSFGKMAKESLLQVLAYYALMKPTVPNIRFVGFVLPMQRDILLFDLNNWDSSKFLNILVTKANEVDKSSPATIEDILAAILANLQVTTFPIGSHISKGNNIAASLTQYVSQSPGTPCQMFLANPRTGKRSAKTATQVIAAAEVIRNTGLLYFTHAPYVINLCANNHDEKTGHWQQRILNEDLDLTVQMGGRGVVVHTGAACGKTLDEALNIMEVMVRNAVTHATEQCPLLLETPCGEGTEIVTKIEEFGMFFYRFSEEERKRMGVCIDTCHVFAAGYDPLDYLKHWEQHCKIPIKLVHYNDSAVAKGSKVDRHAPAGTGYIGKGKMDAVAQWCVDRQIPMVYE